MAAKKTKSAKKAAPKKAKTVTKQKAPAPRAKKAAPKKRKGTPRSPPMHATVRHPELEDEAHEEVFEIFKVYDRDGSGSIDRAEFARLLEALGQTPDETELTIALDVVDANHSGRISWDEFKAWWSTR